MIEMWIVHFESEGCEVHFLLFRDIKMFITPFNDKISVDWNRTRIPNLIYMLLIKKPLTLKYKRIYSEKKKKWNESVFLKKTFKTNESIRYIDMHVFRRPQLTIRSRGERNCSTKLAFHAQYTRFDEKF